MASGSTFSAARSVSSAGNSSAANMVPTGPRR
jgi:hypothetical protein